MTFISLQDSKRNLSAFGGLPLVSKIWDYSALESELLPLMPEKKAASPKSQTLKFRNLAFGAICGAECLDDFYWLKEDRGFQTVCGHVHAPNSFGDFLREFSKVQSRKINDALSQSAFKLRRASQQNRKEFVLDIDSTPHVQHGEKMQGLAFNYKQMWCLDSIAAFDELGFQYWSEVRPGNTHTSRGAPEIISSIFAKAKTELKPKTPLYLRMDSGYCSYANMNAASLAGAKFVITMNENMMNPLTLKVTNWKSQSKKKKDRILFYDGRECEIGTTLLYSRKSNAPYRAVIIRAKKPESKGFIHLWDDYDFYGWITSIGQHEMTPEKVIKFYRKRGNAENFIKELKNGFDLKNFPCQKLTANKIYAQINAFAHNIMRLCSFIEKPDKLKKFHFSKLLRVKMICIVCEVVSHAKQIAFRINPKKRKEVETWLTTARLLLYQQNSHAF